MPDTGRDRGRRHAGYRPGPGGRHAGYRPGPRSASCRIPAGDDGVLAAAGERPAENAWLGLIEVPAGSLLGAVVASAARAAVAFTSPPATVERDRVLVVASGGRPSAGRVEAGPVADGDQVPERGRRPVARGLARVGAGTGRQAGQPDAGKPGTGTAPGRPASGGPASGGPASGGPASGGPASGGPALWRPFAGWPTSRWLSVAGRWRADLSASMGNGTTARAGEGQAPAGARVRQLEPQRGRGRSRRPARPACQPHRARRTGRARWSAGWSGLLSRPARLATRWPRSRR